MDFLKSSFSFTEKVSRKYRVSIYLLPLASSFSVSPIIDILHCVLHLLQLMRQC